MIHPATKLSFINDEIGHGVVATELIPKGTIVWAFDELDRTFPESDLMTFRAPIREAVLTYCFRNRDGHYVLCWDHARFVNHSFRPNCLSTAYGLELAVRDIQAGEELTNDYGHLNIIESFRAADEGTRRKCVHPDDLVRHHQTWDQKLQAAFKQLLSVPQPLSPVLHPSTWDTCTRIARGEEKMASILNIYFDPANSTR